MKLETFFEKFDQFADAQDAVGKMRELVFQLAVQGRLVQQDRTEESATVLLKRIRAARAELPTNRRSIDETDTTELEEESTPFAAPSGWTWTSLGNVQVFTNGYAFKSEDYQSSGVGIIRMGELGANGEIDERNMKYVANDIAQSLPETFRVRPGDLLMGMSGSIGKLAINRSDKTYLLNQRVGRLEPILIEKAFLHVFLKTVEQHYLRISFGMAIKNLSTKQINETPFPLPPLAEQKRIVAKVDELMALCDRLALQQQERETRHAALARASLSRFADAPTPANLNLIFHSSYTIPPADLRKSIFTLAVQGKLVPQDPNDEPALALLEQIAAHKAALAKNGKLRGSTTVKPMADDEAEFDLPSNWCWVRFGEIMVNRDGERIPVSKEERETKAKTYDYYGASGVIDKIDGYLFDKPLLLIGEDGANLISRSTPIAYIARGQYWVNNHAHVLDGISEDFLQFIELHINAINLEKYVTGSAQPKMNQAKMNSIPVALPPLAEQRRIVAKVEQLMALVDALEQQLAASRATAADLLSALVAELTGTPNDGKVSVPSASTTIRRGRPRKSP